MKKFRLRDASNAGWVAAQEARTKQNSVNVQIRIQAFPELSRKSSANIDGKAAEARTQQQQIRRFVATQLLQRLRLPLHNCCFNVTNLDLASCPLHLAAWTPKMHICLFGTPGNGKKSVKRAAPKAFFCEVLEGAFVLEARKIRKDVTRMLTQVSKQHDGMCCIMMKCDIYHRNHPVSEYSYLSYPGIRRVPADSPLMPGIELFVEAGAGTSSMNNNYIREDSSHRVKMDDVRSLITRMHKQAKLCTTEHVHESAQGDTGVNYFTSGHIRTMLDDFSKMSRCSEGRTELSEYFDKNWDACRDAAKRLSTKQVRRSDRTTMDLAQLDTAQLSSAQLDTAQLSSAQLFLNITLLGPLSAASAKMRSSQLSTTSLSPFRGGRGALGLWALTASSLLSDSGFESLPVTTLPPADQTVSHVTGLHSLPRSKGGPESWLG
ncbi:hypothetical protein ON010_g14865 [Phytophthora cinnamomi]|nr:hypothetical protein ON010_g14865 [Phytophthora cinnamomi]